MRAEALNLAAVLSSAEVDFYTIPMYQRPYTWDKDNISVLWDDLYESYTEYLTALQQEREPDYYFLGPVVFVKNRLTRSFDIIDGQQRTTTLHILFWMLLNSVTDATEKARIKAILNFHDSGPKLRVSANDAAVYLAISQNQTPVLGGSKMAVCANLLSEKVSSLPDKDSFSQFLRDYTQFIMIVADDYSKAWDLFIGLNGKGEPLNPTDLVKAFVTGRAIDGATASDIWDEKILRLGTNSTAYLMFLSRFIAKKFISENALFREITRLYPDQLSVHALSANSDIFYLFWLANDTEIEDYFQGQSPLTTNGTKHLSVLRDIGRRDFTSLLFQFASAFGIEAIFDEELLRVLSSFQLRMVVASKRSREKKFISWFAQVDLCNVNGDPALPLKDQAIKYILNKLRSDAPLDNDFNQLVKRLTYSDKTSRLILKHYEEGVRGVRRISDFQIEHLMPQTGTAFWYQAAGVLDDQNRPDKDLYGRIVDSIGNLFVIDSQTNIQSRNRSFDEKKTFYLIHLPDWSITREVQNRTYWRRPEIDGRTSIIADWALNYWAL